MISNYLKYNTINELINEFYIDKPITEKQYEYIRKYLKEYRNILKANCGSLQCIVAVDLNLGIGYNNDLLYHNKKDMEKFKEYTMGKVVVMGGKTFRSLPCYPHGLIGRTTLVLSSTELGKTDMNSHKEKLYIVNNKSALHETIREFLDEGKDVVICGGSSVYKEFKDFYDEMLITTYNIKFDNVDTYFPEPDYLLYKDPIKIKTSFDEHLDVPIYWKLYNKKE